MMAIALVGFFLLPVVFVYRVNQYIYSVMISNETQGQTRRRKIKHVIYSKRTTLFIQKV